MYRATGPGKVEVLSQTADAVEALLYNFDFDDFAGNKFRPLKPEHTAFLKEHIVPLLEGNKGNVWMQGSASQIGPDKWNMTLSLVRVGTVQAFLLDQGIKNDQIETNAVGETLAKTHALDDQRDRSVLLVVHPRVEDRPVPKKIPPRPRPKTSLQFKIAVDADFPERWKSAHRNISWGTKVITKIVKKLPVSTRDVPFTVWDTANNLACRYVYIDVNAGFSFSAGDKVASPHGPWNTFTTEKAMGCWQFGRGARLTTVGAGSKSKTYIHIDTPQGISNVYTEIDTGVTTKGAAGSFGVLGDFILMEGPKPFTGP
jgi:hypothetical protein